MGDFFQDIRDRANQRRAAINNGLPNATTLGANPDQSAEAQRQRLANVAGATGGLYTGAVGYFSANGDMDTAIALRTAIIKDEMMYVQAGGGVVYDSNEEYEYNETVNKSQALFKAAKDAILNNLKE